jgi:hypothetical protein
MNKMFGTDPLEFMDFFALFLLSSVRLVYLEISKKLRSRKAGLMA